MTTGNTQLLQMPGRSIERADIPAGEMLGSKAHLRLLEA